MEKGDQLARRFKDLFISGKWIANTNYKALIVDLNWHHATQKVRSLNTIASLVFHMNYYLAGVLRVFEGWPLEIRDKYSFDMPPIQSEKDWQKMRDQFLDNAEKFANRVENMTDYELAQPFVKEEYGNYRRNIEGMIEHGYYHMGQISLIKKMILESEPE